MAQAEGYLLSSLLTLASHNHTHALEEGGRRPLLLRSVRRAQDFLHSRVTEPLSLADVCQHLGESARALQLAFKQDTGQSPMAYLRDLRIDRVRETLLQADHPARATVSQVAAQHGFLHLGAFRCAVSQALRRTSRPDATRCTPCRAGVSLFSLKSLQCGSGV